MQAKALKSDLLLLLIAIIWGGGFVAQRQGMESLGPFTFNALRFAIGSVSLVPLILLGRRRRRAGAAARFQHSDRAVCPWLRHSSSHHFNRRSGALDPEAR